MPFGCETHSSLTAPLNSRRMRSWLQDQVAEPPLIPNGFEHAPPPLHPLRKRSCGKLCDSRGKTFRYGMHHTGVPPPMWWMWVELGLMKRLHTEKQTPLRYRIRCFSHQVYDKAWRPLQPDDASQGQEGGCFGVADTSDVTSLGPPAILTGRTCSILGSIPFGRPDKRLIGATVALRPEGGNAKMLW